MCEAQGGLDVFDLGALITTGKKNDQFSPPLLEIHPVTGTVVNPQLRDTFTDWLYITWVSRCQPFNPCSDARSSLDVPQVVEPLNEEVGLANFNHGVTVATWLHIVKAAYCVLICPTRPISRRGSLAIYGDFELSGDG